METNPIGNKNITIDEFFQITSNIDIRYGQILLAERIPKSKKLLKLTVIFGENLSDEKTIVTNIGDKFEPESMLAMVLPFLLNIPPTEIMGVKSEGMIILPTFNGNPQLDIISIGSKLF